MNKKAISSSQMDVWSSNFGREYTDRNPKSADELNELYKNNFGLSREALNGEFLANFERGIRILEVGCNRGLQIEILKRMGFENIVGLELQEYALEIARERIRDVEFVQGSAFSLPFPDAHFDLVYTSGVLIHLAPSDLPTALKEILRCTKRYIWGFEYYAQEITQISYRGKANLMWKGPYAEEFKRISSELSLIKEKKIAYLSGPAGQMDQMYLLEKNSKATSLR